MRQTARIGLLSVGVCLGAIHSLFAQPKAEIRTTPEINFEQAGKRGQELVANLLAQSPESDSTASGVLRIRDPNGSTSEVKVEFTVNVTSTNVMHRYTAMATNGAPLEAVIVSQRQGQPNEYFLAQGTEAPRQLSRGEVMRPFAGSDFWVADLGLDFLHWPGQLVTGWQMRRGQSCEVLESTLPNPPAGGYSKVVSWIASQKPGVMLVHADAYDTRGRLLKQFDPKKLQRVEGQWQLRSMEIRNRVTGSRSTIEFDLGE